MRNYTEEFLFKFWVIVRPAIFIFLTTIFIIYSIDNLLGQTFYYPALDVLYKLELNNNVCGNSCNSQSIANLICCCDEQGISFGPDGNLYTLGYTGSSPPYVTEIHITDTLDPSICTLIFSSPPNFPFMEGFVSVGGGIFYTMEWYFAMSDLLYRWDTNAGTITSIGSTGYFCHSDLTMAGGQIYYETRNISLNTNSIVRLDTLNPANSEIVVS